jgi:AbrB family looped-hinge helix DNA binding protein
MSRPSSLTTTLSTKGQIILPAAIRKARAWPPGTRLVVEDTTEGVLIKAAPLFPATKPADVFGSLPHKGPPLTLEEMDAAVAAEARRRHAGD